MCPCRPREGDDMLALDHQTNPREPPPLLITFQVDVKRSSGKDSQLQLFVSVFRREVGTQWDRKKIRGKRRERAERKRGSNRQPASRASTRRWCGLSLSVAHPSRSPRRDGSVSVPRPSPSSLSRPFPPFDSSIAGLGCDDRISKGD